MPIRSIAYISTANLTTTDNSLENSVAHIIEASRRNNKKNDLTGALLYNGGYFIQILEGPDKALEETLARVKKDTRHSELRILSDHVIEKRRFSKWDMALAGIEADYVPNLNAQLKSFDEIDAPDSGKAALKILVDMLDRFEIKLD